jgi:HEPN superfamily AbiU2-like protein
MSTSESLFEHELEIFRHEAEAGTQFFYSHLAVHALAGKHEEIETVLNEAPLFWNTSLGALQSAAFVTLGRIFDQKSPHNVDRLLQIARQSLPIFSKRE